jgi:hypothetical protein
MLTLQIEKRDFHLLVEYWKKRKAIARSAIKLRGFSGQFSLMPTNA